MLRLCCQLLLILSLVCNGIAAPWAMARMHHQGHGGHAGTAAAAAHAGHAHHATGHVTDDHALPASDDGACCGTPECRCGCMLPGMLPLNIAFALPQPSPAKAPPWRDVGIVAARGTPPFRPPA